MSRHRALWQTCVRRGARVLVFMPLLAVQQPALAGSDGAAGTSQSRCEAMAAGGNITAAVWHPAGLVIDNGREGKSPPLPAHCEVSGVLQPRVGEGGQHYAIRFRMRLPEAWNQRFFFQGGGGSNGVIGTAAGPEGIGNPLALSQGYAVVSQDSGHDNLTNNDPARGGVLVFGFDPIARRNYGHASLKLTNDAAHVILRRFYRRDARFSYFYGCSKGGQEGMAFAQKYPRSFDGIVAAAPGFSLPKAAVAQIWDVQKFAAINSARDIGALARTFSDSDFSIVRNAILGTCDADDGVADGMVSAVGLCTTPRVRQALSRHICSGDNTDACLTGAQVDALVSSVEGPRTANGASLYAPFAWDPGIGLGGWRVWKIGTADAMPALSVVLGGGSLASVFTTKPTPLAASPDALIRWALDFDFDSDAARIFATSDDFKTSAWQDISARSPDLAAFRAHGGRMIVPHGVADPVFSVNDTLAWWNEVDGRAHGHADAFVRVFPVPGMNHCAGGDATDRFDAFKALVDWVEKHQPPDKLLASAGPGTHWPGRTRPLCAYPNVALYKGVGDVGAAENFACAATPARSSTLFSSSANGAIANAP